MLDVAPSPDLKLSAGCRARLRSPCCQSHLIPRTAEFICGTCQNAYPICNGVPVLIDERSSLFNIEGVLRDMQRAPAKSARFKQDLLRALPQLTGNIKGRTNFRKLAGMLSAGMASTGAVPRAETPPIVLIVGGRILGAGMEELSRAPNIELVETDVVYGPRTILVCDGHALPFDSESFDAVVIQAVLEHVVDPRRCVEEIHRVLKPGGLVYAEIPFMQQVHAGRYDFTRFTHLGLRRLFRNFTELESGATCGVGSALAWSWQYLLFSCTRSQAGRKLLMVLARFTAFWCKYLDYLLIDTPGTLDGASAYYLFGRKSDQELSDRDLIASYQGAH